MYLKLNKRDFSWSRIKKAFPVFLLLWLGAFVLSATFLYSAKMHLHNIEMVEAEHSLDMFIAGSRLPGNVLGRLSQWSGNLPEGLVFVRIAWSGEHLILVNEISKMEGFSELAEVPVEKRGVWLRLPDADNTASPMLTVVVRKLDNGVILQAGKNAEDGYRLYRQLYKDTVYGLVIGVLVLWLLALFFIRQSLAPLIHTRARVHELQRQPHGGNLPEKGNGPELDDLYCEINSLLAKNRQLVTEMQQSLDNVAHDLRTPMTRLRSVAEYGLQADDDPQRLRDSLADCLEESERVIGMLKIMMSVAEAESGAMRLDKKECDLRESLEQIVNLYEYVAQEKEITITLNGPKSFPVWLDCTRISQVWANLVDNAIKYGKDGGWLKIELKRDGSDAVIIFMDNGMGISAAEQPRVWERLYRGDRSRSQKGLGLGLNYVRAVVTAHGGSVELLSELHQGSTFWVRLPVVDAVVSEKSQISGE